MAIWNDTADELMEQALQHTFGSRYNFLGQNNTLDETPERVVRMLREFTQPEDFKFTTFDTNQDEMIVVQDIPFVSLCAHHLLPFIGHAHIGYVPNGKMAGLSKLARTVKYHAAGLNVQETLTHNIALYLEDHLNPLGVAVVLKADHTCMTLRGVKANGAMTTTSVMRGVYADHDRLARQEFFELLGA